MAKLDRYMIQREGRYYTRMVVPPLLQKIIGRTELRVPLGGDLKLARKRHPGEVDAMHKRLAEASSQIGAAASRRSLTDGEFAQAVFDLEVRHDDYYRDISVLSEAAFLKERELYRFGLRRRLRLASQGELCDEELSALVGPALDELKRCGNLPEKVGEPEWRRKACLAALVKVEVLERAKRLDEGREPPPFANLVPAKSDGPAPVYFSDLFAAYFLELKALGRGAESERRWKLVPERLRQHFGHDDVARMTKKGISGWKDHLRIIHSPKTIKDVDLASVRTILNWAVANGRIDQNPAAGITVRHVKSVRSREQGFDDQEARAILSASYAHQPTVGATPQTSEAAWNSAAKRWIPWLCAYTGARVGEIAQLRKQDVTERDGIAFLRITPDAGTVKTGQYRDVPIHEHLVEQGFLTFVSLRKDGPIFTSQKPRLGNAPSSRNVAGKVAKWINSLKVADHSIAPNHGWRHRFKTVGMEAGIEVRILDAIQGHAARTAGEAYGDVIPTAFTIDRYAPICAFRLT